MRSRSSMDMRASFGNRVRRLRAEHRWTQEELAERAGLTPNYVGRIERGEVSASLCVAAQLSDALGMRLDQLLRLPDASEHLREAPREQLSADEVKQIQQALAILQRLFS
jgi:XRE family transcriptional regulator, regulator of sulfur utilization